MSKNKDAEPTISEFKKRMSEYQRKITANKPSGLNSEPQGKINKQGSTL